MLMLYRKSGVVVVVGGGGGVKGKRSQIREALSRGRPFARSFIR